MSKWPTGKAVLGERIPMSSAYAVLFFYKLVVYILHDAPPTYIVYRIKYLQFF